MSEQEYLGVCRKCGATGLMGLSCSDPDCTGMVDEPIGGPEMAAKAGAASAEKYDKNLIDDIEDDEEGRTVSLESLQEEEAADEPDNDEDL